MGITLTPTGLAELAGVHQTTILKAIQAGKVPATTTPGGHFRISAQAAAEFLQSMGIDPRQLMRHKVQVVAFLGEPDVVDAVRAAVVRDNRFELFESRDLLEMGVLIERLEPEIAVLDTGKFNGDVAATLKTLQDRDVRVLGLGSEAEGARLSEFGKSAPGAWLKIPFTVEEFLHQLRELVEGTRIWRQLAQRKA